MKSYEGRGRFPSRCCSGRGTRKKPSMRPFKRANSICWSWEPPEGLKQFPDNIPMITGLMGAYSDNGNDAKAAFFSDYARDVVSRAWGEEYIEKLGLD